MPADQEFLQKVLENLVKNPKEVKVERTVNELGVLLTVHVNKEDVGTVIGKNGQTISALRHLTRAVGRRHQALVSIKLAENLTQPKA